MHQDYDDYNFNIFPSLYLSHFNQEARFTGEINFKENQDGKAETTITFNFKIENCLRMNLGKHLGFIVDLMASKAVEAFNNYLKKGNIIKFRFADIYKSAKDFIEDAAEDAIKAITFKGLR